MLTVNIYENSICILNTILLLKSILFSPLSNLRRREDIKNNVVSVVDISFIHWLIYEPPGHSLYKLISIYDKHYQCCCVRGCLFSQILNLLRSAYIHQGQLRQVFPQWDSFKQIDATPWIPSLQPYWQILHFVVLTIQSFKRWVLKNIYTEYLVFCSLTGWISIFGPKASQIHIYFTIRIG